jgi:deoxyribonuclease V
MAPASLHPRPIDPRAPVWPKTVAQARVVQERLRGRVIGRDRFGRIRHVAGIDVGFENDGTIARAAIVVLSYPDLTPVAQATARRRVRFPYVPGYLSFREIPVALAALARARIKPDLLLCDGQGYAHPRRFGLACHLGVLTGIPSIGVAKSRLIGEHGALGPAKGAWTRLRDGEEVIGAVLRTRPLTRPLFISIGHRVSLASAIELVLRCTTCYRLPETTRAAHRLASG